MTAALTPGPRADMSARVQRPLSHDVIERARRPFDEAVPLPRAAYVDAEIFAFERDRIFGRSWICVAREDEVAAPGRRLVAPLTRAGVLVVRGVDLALRAFHNTCLHRAMPLATGPGRSDHLTCPYHGWRYDTRGRLDHAPDALACLEQRRRELALVRVDVWGGFVFICLDDGAPPLREALGGVPPWLVDAPVSSLVSVHRREHTTRANWKLVVENFQESHHFPSVHPLLERLTPTAAARSWGAGGPWLGGTMKIEAPNTTVSATGASTRRAISDQGVVFDAMLFPGLLTSLQPDYLLTYRLWPVAVDETRVTFEILVHPASAGPGADHDDLVSFWARVNEEDRAVVERQAEGMASPGPDPVAYSRVEDGVHAFDALVARAHEGSDR